jgi:hypothetical protein
MNCTAGQGRAEWFLSFIEWKDQSMSCGSSSETLSGATYLIDENAATVTEIAPQLVGCMAG